MAAAHRVWQPTAYALNCEWLNLRRWPSLALLTLLLVGLGLTVGFTAMPVKDGVTLGVEFGGGYNILYACVQKANSTAEVNSDTMEAQARDMQEICHSNGAPNAVVTVLKPNKIQVIIPGVTSKEQISPILTAFEDLPLGMEIRSAISMSGSMGHQDLNDTLLAAGVALAIVWGCLVLRYGVAGLLGLYLCIVYIWLHLIFFNASAYALSDAAIVAVVLNIGLGADAHIIAFERVREDLHALPRDAPRELGLKAMEHGLRVALITVLEANVSTILAMASLRLQAGVVLYGIGIGATVEFAFTVLISVCASILINVLLARVILRLAWCGELIATGGFFGDKGPAYDEEKRAQYERISNCLSTDAWVRIPYWKPARRINIDFIRIWWVGALATIAVIIAGSVLLATQGLNWGVDYTAGTSVAMVIPPPYDYTCADVTKYAERRSNATVSRCSIADQGHVELRFKNALDPHKLQLIIFRITSILGGPIIYNEYTIDNTLAVEQSQRAILAMVIAAVVTCAFILLRFGPGFSLSGFLSLASAGLFAICCFAMGSYEVNLPIISAILTVFSYAINDCVVVFDRIRFELGELGGPPSGAPELRATVNRAMGLVTIRSLLTLAVVLVCSICLIALGPQGLESFSLAITFGLLNACYTTLLICAPFWYMLRVWTMAYLACRTAKKAGADASPPSTPEWGAGKSETGSLAKMNSASTSSFMRMASQKEGSLKPDAAAPAAQ